MTINARAEIFFTIVAVDDFDFFASDEAVEFLECSFVSFGGADIVTGGEYVASVEADGEILWVISEIENRGDLFKFIVQT